MPPVIYLLTIPGDVEGEGAGGGSLLQFFFVRLWQFVFCIVSSSSLLILVPGGGCTS